MLHAWIDPAACAGVETRAAVCMALGEGATAVVLRVRTLAVERQRELAVELDSCELPEHSILWAGDPAVAVGDRSWCAGVQLSALMIDRIEAARAHGYAAVACSVHSAMELQLARGADLVTLSPVFPPRSKPFAGTTLGLDGLAALARRSPTPALALGGVTPADVLGIARAGLRGVAALSPFCRADRTEARALVAAVRAVSWDGGAP